MIKSVSVKSKWLAGLVLVTIAALLISGACVANTLPTISSLTVMTEGEINPGATAWIECTAIDADDEDLSYTWSADTGTLSGSGSMVNWTAPETPGTYTVSVEVSDGDDIATDHLTITVLIPNNPPIIESLSTDCPRVKPGGHGTITCVASDPDGDELTYTWTAERGSFEGEGAEVIWWAPGDYGYYAITVTVSDGRGGEVSSSEVTNLTEGKISVCSCGSACE
ncbi:MAG: PKD domain-containing protein [Dehalococcoidia bacterium]